MNNHIKYQSLYRSLEASNAYYAMKFTPFRSKKEQIRSENKHKIIGIYDELAIIESSLQEIEGDLEVDCASNDHFYRAKTGSNSDSVSWNGGNDGDFDEDDFADGDVLPSKKVPYPNGKVPNVANIFIGGAGDKDKNHNVLKSSSLNKNIYGTNYYATHNQQDEANKQIGKLQKDTKVNVIGHSWGGDTAAKVALDNPNRVGVLVTIDPVTTFGSKPDFGKLNKNVGVWVDVNATGNPNSSVLDGFFNGNIVAGTGDWGKDPKGHADIFISAPYNHADFDQMMNYPSGQDNKPSATQVINVHP